MGSLPLTQLDACRPCCSVNASSAVCAAAGMADKAKELGLREFEDKQKATIGQVRSVDHSIYCL